MLVSVFAATTYYAIPDGRHIRSIAFALGPKSMNSVNASVYSLGAWVNATFQNGTTWDSMYHPDETGVNSTDIIEIVILPLPMYGGGFDLQEPYLTTMQYAFDWTIGTSFAGENPVNLGVLDVANYTFSFYSTGGHYPIPYNFSVPTLDYKLGVNTSGYWDIGRPPPFYGPWTWRMNGDRIQDILLNASANPVDIPFDLVITVNLYYEIMTSGVTQAGYARVEWSGRWGVLQLFHEANTLLGLRYQFTNIGLRMTAT
jgi:hypothetical protein